MSKKTNDGSETHLNSRLMPLLCYIHVEHTEDYGWIIELPQVYPEGIEFENIFEDFETKKEVVTRAKNIQKTTKLPIIIYSKNGSAKTLYAAEPNKTNKLEA